MRMIRKKLRIEKAVQSEVGFPQVSGPHYLMYLQHLHDKLKPRAYFEIGTESGASLSMATCASVAVDPAFALQADVSRNKPQLHQFQMTSDDFFATGFLDRAELTFDLAFLDGMHQFEFLLRDFIAIERHMSSDGLVAMHDCVPFSRRGAERVWDRSKPGGWTGDVWKLVPILRQWRPDLTVEVLDLSPSGLEVVRGLDQSNHVLSDNYAAIVDAHRDMTIDDFGLDRFSTLANLKPALLALTPEPTPRPKHGDLLAIAMKTSVRTPADNAHYGDYYFALALGKAFDAAGHAHRIESYSEWNSDGGTADFDLVLHGSRTWEQRPTVPSVHWLLYPGSRKKRDLRSELATGQHVFVSSLIDAKVWRDRLPGVPVTALMQGFDAEVMHPGDDPRGTEIVFVGSNHKGMRGGRPIVDMAVAAGVPIQLYGRGWEGHPAEPQLVADFIDNARLGDLYRGAGIVLCDHMPSMREAGYVSNRIYDALACGAPVISDTVKGLPSEFEDYVTLCVTPDDFAAAVATIRAETARKRDQRRAFAAGMRDRHSLQARAAEILTVLSGLKAVAAPVVTETTG